MSPGRITPPQEVVRGRERGLHAQADKSTLSGLYACSVKRLMSLCPFVCVSICSFPFLSLCAMLARSLARFPSQHSRAPKNAHKPCGVYSFLYDFMLSSSRVHGSRPKPETLDIPFEKVSGL